MIDLRSSRPGGVRALALVSPLLLLLAFAGAAEFPAPYNSEPDEKTPRLSAADAAAQFKLPAGFKATVFAAEPDVQNPIAMAWDARGRLWIAENYTYAERAKKFDLKLRDRVLIFEDADGDGRFDKRIVFSDQVQMLTSVEVGLGGVWLMCPPQLLFVPDANGDDVPDGPAQVLLDGFDPPPENYHNFANGLRWGPDGWLYGRCGASSPGDIGAPGTPAARRVPMRGGMWRYHPRLKRFEALTHGTTNPWGHDWNEFGELFFINTVNGHLWHNIPGAHFVRPHTVDPNPYAYSLIDMHADHWHFDTGKSWTASRDGKADAWGGGHAHCGAMIYLGDNWPAEYRGKLYTINYHGRRLNTEKLVREGSGYVGKHEPDMAFSADRWFRGIDLSYGPDGGVYLLDWSDSGECHDSTGVHRLSGRIFKITYGDAKAPAIKDVSKLSAAELVRLHEHANEWYCRMARLELARRARDIFSTRIAPPFPGELKALVEKHSDPIVRVRALCTLHAIGIGKSLLKDLAVKEMPDEAFVRGLLGDPNEHIRAWAIRMLTDGLPLDTVFGQRHPDAKPEDRLTPQVMDALARMAREDKSALVRLTLASTLQRLPLEQRASLAEPLLSHAEDSGDHNIPLMLWYGILPLGTESPAQLAQLGSRCQIPLTRRLIARRLAEAGDDHIGAVNTLLDAAKDSDAFLADILAGLREGYRGRRKAAKPALWDALAAKVAPASLPVVDASQDAAKAGVAQPPPPLPPLAKGGMTLRERVRDLSVLFGDGRALDEVKRIALDGNADLNSRRTAVRTLIESRPPDLQEICLKLLSVKFLNAAAARGLALFDDPATGQKLAKSYRSFHPTDRPALIETLATRPAFAGPLLEELATGRIPRSDVTPFHARQIRGFGDEALNKRLAEAWGELRESTAEKRALMTRLKEQLAPAALAKADLGQGRLLFNKSCASCHVLYGEGGRIGPDITGAARDNLDYLLENIADPSAVVSADFRMSVVGSTDGRVWNGIVLAQTAKSLTLQTPTEKLTIQKEDVKRIAPSAQSLMPEGLLETLDAAQVRDLFGYLMHRTQVPLPAGAAPAAPEALGK